MRHIHLLINSKCLLLLLLINDILLIDAFHLNRAKRQIQAIPPSFLLYLTHILPFMMAIKLRKRLIILPIPIPMRLPIPQTTSQQPPPPTPQPIPLHLLTLPQPPPPIMPSMNMNMVDSGILGAINLILMHLMINHKKRSSWHEDRWNMAIPSNSFNMIPTMPAMPLMPMNPWIPIVILPHWLANYTQNNNNDDDSNNNHNNYNNHNHHNYHNYHNHIHNRNITLKSW